MGLSEKEIQELLLIDLLPHDIYIKNEQGYEVIIPKGCSIPARKTVEFENQEYLNVEVYRKKEDDDSFFVFLLFIHNWLEIGRIWIQTE